MGRRVSAWLVGAVVTVALVAGGVLAARGDRDRSPAVLPALELDAAAADAAAAAAVARGPAPARSGGVAPARPYDTGDAVLPLPKVTYRLKGPLPTLPDRAAAWRVGADPDPGRVAALAGALGLRGRPREDRSGWTVTDGRRSLRVFRLAGMPWTYGIQATGGCAVRWPGGGPYRPGGGIQCLDSAATRPLRAVDRPTREQAERAARDLAAGAGLELAGAEIRVTDAYAARLVDIAPAVGGVPTSGFAWNVGVGPGGRVRYASGWLATPERADTYPLIGVEEGFERLKRSPPLGHLRRPNAPAVERDPCPAGGKVPCAARPFPARVATVTGVRLGLRLAPGLERGDRPGGAGYLLPAYLFELEGGWTDVRAVVAVQDRYLTRP